MKRDGSQVFHVAAAEAGLTLAAFLRRHLPDTSWGAVRKQIRGRRLQIDGNLCLDESRRLKEGEVVKLLAQAQAAPPREDDVRIRYVDTHVVVVEKPAGMTTLRHSEERFWPERRKQRQPTLDEVVARILARRGTPSPPRGPSRPAARDADRRPRIVPVRPVHRLDRETSGLMVFARTPLAERGLVQQFRRHSIHRAYLAVAHGDVAAQTIDLRLVRDRGDGRRGSTTLPTVGQRAVTHVQPVEQLAGYTVVACRLETGRTHQIRIHLAERGHYVCGDKVYCQPLFQQPLRDLSRAPRLALHAAELGFVHPVTGAELRFTMPLPPDLQQFLNALRRAAGHPETGSPPVPSTGWPASLSMEKPPAGDDDDEAGDDDEFAAQAEEIPDPTPPRRGAGRTGRPRPASGKPAAPQRPRSRPATPDASESRRPPRKPRQERRQRRGRGRQR